MTKIGKSIHPEIRLLTKEGIGLRGIDLGGVGLGGLI